MRQPSLKAIPLVLLTLLATCGPTVVRFEIQLLVKGKDIKVHYKGALYQPHLKKIKAGIEAGMLLNVMVSLVGRRSNGCLGWPAASKGHRWSFAPGQPGRFPWTWLVRFSLSPFGAFRGRGWNRGLLDFRARGTLAIRFGPVRISSSGRLT